MGASVFIRTLDYLSRSHITYTVCYKLVKLPCYRCYLQVLASSLLVSYNSHKKDFKYWSVAIDSLFVSHKQTVTSDAFIYEVYMDTSITSPLCSSSVGLIGTPITSLAIIVTNYNIMPNIYDGIIWCSDLRNFVLWISSIVSL